MHLSPKLAVAVSALAIASVSGSSLAGAATTKPSAAAVKHCKALEKKDGKSKFEKKYGKKSPLKKCETAYDKKHKTGSGY
jgi:hypothetical protein